MTTFIIIYNLILKDSRLNHPGGKDMQEVIEPLAKFHAIVTSKGRFTIPKETRRVFGIDEGDYVELLIRKLDPNTNKPLRRAITILRVGTNGRGVIPSELTKRLDIQLGEIVEVLLITFFKPEDILSDKVRFKKYIPDLIRKGYAIISEEDEKEIIQFRI
ncbi:MAG: AbrB/MazE/SpoVT family DNA-binding domain-containing protein [Thermococcus sp.]|uniref:AbrB/MazE/SpoVT family DNA-binding domain-containing protein n=1 Tax=Thermococcus sp. TaxID=35749 RepID=UPI001D7234F7|nr:AbrB/MazE/SpoVT family DNA-binding domain-containing protein [Thermococcus sp.]MBO8175739.1 AbrB/MazE/SpoVT family DNA-binding domain-containing protein [Thermococcus sp.]